jgi:hypothetical protein
VNFSVGGHEFGLKSEGFIRTAREGDSTYGQPQLWLTPKNSSLDYGVEVEVIGGDRRFRAGVRKRF